MAAKGFNCSLPQRRTFTLFAPCRFQSLVMNDKNAISKYTSFNNGSKKGGGGVDADDMSDDYGY